jgi:cytoskeletal protein CcmA (bactofilin family)
MADTTVIGRSAFVRGRIVGTGDIEILGRVEGEITCNGEVTVDSSGLVSAPIAAQRIVVRGAVKGDLTAEDTLVIEHGAKVVGDLSAPRITIQTGGLVRGHVQTGNAGTAPARRTASAAKPAPAPAAKAAPKPAPPAAKPVAPVAKPAAKPIAKPAATSNVPRIQMPVATPPRGATLAGGRPPAPIVPVLKKGTKAVAKKRGA